MTRNSLSDWILRAGIAFVFLYPPYAEIGDPTSWLGYFPPFILAGAHQLGISDLVLLHSFGALEVVIALWILSGWRVYIPAFAAVAMLLSIVGFGWNDLDVLFRDIGLAALALALAVGHLPARAGLPALGERSKLAI